MYIYNINDTYSLYNIEAGGAIYIGRSVIGSQGNSDVLAAAILCCIHQQMNGQALNYTVDHCEMSDGGELYE